MLYNRKIKFHDNNDLVIESELKLETRNGYVEFTLCNVNGQSDFEPKGKYQDRLHNIWDNHHIKKYCELDEEAKIEKFIDELNDICFNIEKEELNYVNNLNEFEINDEKILALKEFLGITWKEAYYDIKESNYNSNIFEYGRKEFLILQTDDVDDYEREYVENMIEECYLYELKRGNNPIYNYIDVDKWTDDWCGNAGENLATYDGKENIIGDYHIFRLN